MTDMERTNYETTLRNVKIFKEVANAMISNMDSAELHLTNLLSESKPGEKCMPVSDSYMDIRVQGYINMMKGTIELYDTFVEKKRVKIEKAFDLVKDPDN